MKVSRHLKIVLLIFIITCGSLVVFKLVKQGYTMHSQSKFKGEFLPRIDYETTIHQRKEDVMKYPSPFEIDDDDINVKNGDRVSYSIAPKLKDPLII